MNKKSITPEQLTLYYSPYCPYCHRVLHAMVELGLDPNLEMENARGITLKNTFADREAKKTLKVGGGKTTVPCLSIRNETTVEWLYESADIVSFLQQHFA